MEHHRPTLMIRTSVEVWPMKKILLRLLTLHMAAMVEGPPHFWHLMPKGEWAHNYPCGVCILARSLARLSIYLS
jgi:hypothetical protein